MPRQVPPIVAPIMRAISMDRRMLRAALVRPSQLDPKTEITQSDKSVQTRFKKGDRVRHPAYGEGVILAAGKERIVSNLPCQVVDIQFTSFTKEGIAAEIAGLAMLVEQ